MWSSLENSLNGSRFAFQDPLPPPLSFLHWMQMEAGGEASILQPQGNKWRMNFVSQRNALKS